ncbi:MAG: hypothetical protein NT150_05205 [Bacteroidetes bacterium]|nr:hypothetical protein [Bacteroidota bacterium]
MFIVIALVVLLLVGFVCFLLSKKVHASLKAQGHKQPMAGAILSFILSAAIILYLLVWIIEENMVLGR